MSFFIQLNFINKCIFKVFYNVAYTAILYREEKSSIALASIQKSQSLSILEIFQA